MAKTKDAIWARFERKTGIPFSPKGKEHVEGDYSESADGTLGELDEFENYLEDFFVRVELLGILDSLPAPRQPKHPPGKRYPKPLQRRIHIVDFVIGKILTGDNYSKRTLKLGKRLFTGKKYRVNWLLTTESWNETHPYDEMSLATLKSAFNAAIADEDTRKEYFHTKELAEAEKAMPWIMRELETIYKVLEPEIYKAQKLFHEAQRAIDSIPPEVLDRLRKETQNERTHNQER